VEEIVTAKFLYQPSALLEYLLLLLMLLSVVNARLLTALAVGILLVRPNERMDLTIPFVQILLPLLLLVIVLHRVKLKELPRHGANKYLKLFIVLIGLQTLVFHPSELFNTMLYITVGGLLYCAVIMFMNDDDGIKYLSYAILISCFLICFEPVYYHFNEPEGSLLWAAFHLPQSGRLQAWGMWANANETAYLACLGVANLMILATKFRSTKHNLACGVLIPFFSLVVFLTASRAGFASLLLMFLPSVLFSGRTAVKVLVVAAMLGTVLAAHTLTPERKDTEASTEQRGELRVRGKQMVLEYPFRGVGFGRAAGEASGRPLHNTYLQAFAETGIPGGILLLLFLYNLGRSAFSACATSAPGKQYMVFLFGWYVSSLFYYYWGNQLLSILFFLVAAQVNNGITNALADDDAMKKAEDAAPCVG